MQMLKEMKMDQAVCLCDELAHLVETAPLAPLSNDGQLTLLRHAAHEQ